MAQELISKKTRYEFQEAMTVWVLREITTEFTHNDLYPDEDYVGPLSGERRSLVDQHYHAINFSSWEDVRKLLRVYETVLLRLENRALSTDDGDEEKAMVRHRETLIRLLRRDGFDCVDGQIISLPGSPSFAHLEAISSKLDADQLRLQIDRIRNNIDSDPALAIGAAKELAETTCKTILSDRNISYDADWDLPKLAKATAKELKLTPDDVKEGEKASESMKRLVSNLASIVYSLAELRNIVGTGHGKDGRVRGPRPRHARLAVGAATTLAMFLFETHEATSKPETPAGAK